MFFILGLFSSTALYGVLSLIVSLVAFRVNFKEIFSYAFSATNLHEVFLAYMAWSIPALIVLWLIHILLCKISDKIEWMARPIDLSIGSFLSWLGADIINPFRGMISLIKALKGFDDDGIDLFRDWAGTILHFVWAVGLVVWLVLGFMSF